MRIQIKPSAFDALQRPLFGGNHPAFAASISNRFDVHIATTIFSGANPPLLIEISECVDANLCAILTIFAAFLTRFGPDPVKVARLDSDGIIPSTY